MREHVVIEVAGSFARIVALCALESFLTRMGENVLLEIATVIARIIALSAFERILP